METKNNLRSHHLPQEITEEILSRLPVKSLLRFRCVSKPWHSLIDSKRFIKTHLQNSSRNPSLARHKVLFFSGAKLWQRSVYGSSDTKSLELEFRGRFNSIVGCCNGLVCLLLNEQFVLWNPSARISKKLPHPQPPHVGGETGYRCYTGYGFGWDESSDDHKVFATGVRNMCMIYSLKSDSWKEVNGDLWKSCANHMGEFASGNLHWESRNEGEMVSFDLKREVFEVVELPEPCIGVIGERLAVYERCRSLRCVDIWMMKEYGVKESWEKVVILDLMSRLLLTGVEMRTE
ncbi:F-box/kelch-repeat protein At3g23880-like [Salvia miltiorrhiza]|uniref:F-box/kelch-repeat protein At3g23880-like n=1 Tax=Salvia miltiorrhiza TaxID=226208 RepID=UPI0025AB855F|nr:F-box/kelch-repeat protein At3g23880-like [Salvia miltiorrhiza]